MVKRNRSDQVEAENIELRNRLEETEETLRAIRQYMVDAFVVNRTNGVEVVTLSEADFPYRRMVESMNEGAATLIPDGTIFYCNPRFGGIVRMEPQKLIGVRFQDLLPADQQKHFLDMLQNAGQEGVRGEFCLLVKNGKCVPIQLSIYQLRAGDENGISIIATDISERVQAEEKIRSLASELTIAEQEERHRISQVLHDDLQQRLFAIRAQLSSIIESVETNNITSNTQVSMHQVQDWLSEAITVTRNLSVDISPAVLHGEGIRDVIMWLSSRMKEQHDLDVDIHAQDDFIHLPDHMRVTLFQAVRELLFNIVKHAGVLHATITLEKIDGNGFIDIHDSGNGFDPVAVLTDSHTAHGLMIIRDRLNLLGGTLKIVSEPGHGTQARIKFPIETPSK